MFCHVYVRYGIAYVPTCAQTCAGYYLEIEPVEAAPAADTEAFKAALSAAIARGNPNVPTPSRDAFPRPVVLKYAKTKSWKAFEKTALTWSLDRAGDRYQLVPGKRRHDRGWEDDNDRAETFPSEASLEEVVERAVSRIQTSVMSEGNSVSS
jgi:hypothetical protein